eukprot:1003484-Karenia_brevis.AAC.1
MEMSRNYSSSLFLISPTSSSGPRASQSSPYLASSPSKGNKNPNKGGSKGSGKKGDKKGKGELRA